MKTDLQPTQAQFTAQKLSQSAALVKVLTRQELQAINAGKANVQDISFT